LATKQTKNPASQQLCESARRELTELNPAPKLIMGKLFGHGVVRLARSIRLLCTKVWPMLYQVLTLQQDNVIGIWGLTKEQMIERLPKDRVMNQSMQKFIRLYEPTILQMFR
jgi:hypothetical protein